MPSQHNEEAVLLDLLERIKPDYQKFFLEIGADYRETEIECNTLGLLKYGWNGIVIDADALDHPCTRKDFVTVENFQWLLAKYQVPHNLGVLSIDVDGIDYWLWKSLPKAFTPAVVIIEYNAQLPAWERKAIEYSPEFAWDKTNYYGASLGAMSSLAKTKGYTLFALTCRTNLFFLRDDLMPISIQPADPRQRRYIEV